MTIHNTADVNHDFTFVRVYLKCIFVFNLFVEAHYPTYETGKVKLSLILSPAPAGMLSISLHAGGMIHALWSGFTIFLKDVL